MSNRFAAQVTSDPRIKMGKPMIKNTRIPVELTLRRRTIATVSACALSLAAFAQKAHSTSEHEAIYEGKYLCLPTASGGIRYEENEKIWKGATFGTAAANESIILEIATRKWNDFSSLSVTIREFHTGREKCVELFGEIKHGHILYCIGPFIYKFNLVHLRYIEVYTLGFIDGSDEPGNTPSLTGGQCSKID